MASVKYEWISIENYDFLMKGISFNPSLSSILSKISVVSSSEEVSKLSSTSFFDDFDELFETFNSSYKKLMLSPNYSVFLKSVFSDN